MRIISLVDNDDLGLIAETEVLGATERTKEVLLNLNMARVYDDTKPIVGKSVNPYVPLPYPPGRQVFFNDSVYTSIAPDKTTRAPLTDAEILAQGSPDTQWSRTVTGRDAV